MSKPQTADTASSSQKLKIRPVSTLTGDGESSITLTVWCPRKAQTLEIDACASCERCHGWVLDPSERDSFLMCAPGVPSVVAESDAGVNEGPPVRDLMSTGVHAVREEVSLDAAVGLMMEFGISGVPVVDEKGRAIGIVSKSDLVRMMQDSGEDAETEQRTRMQVGDVDVDLPPGFHVTRLARATVGDVMTPLAFVVREGTSVGRAAALMTFEGVHRVPVTGDDGKVTGVLSAMDVLRWVAKEAGFDG